MYSLSIMRSFMPCVREEIIPINHGLRISFLDRKYLLRKLRRNSYAARGKLFTMWLIFYICSNFYQLASQYLTFQKRRLRFGDIEQFVLYYGWCRVMTAFKSKRVCLKALWNQLDHTTLREHVPFPLAPSKGEMRGKSVECGSGNDSKNI